MATVHHRIREVAAVTRQQRHRTMQAASAAAAPATPHGLALALGTRVLDLVTGQTGEIIDGRAEHIITNGAGKPAG